jgi:hypothetical protein
LPSEPQVGEDKAVSVASALAIAGLQRSPAKDFALVKGSLIEDGGEPI